jgi:hypothetical protein
VTKVARRRRQAQIRDRHTPLDLFASLDGGVAAAGSSTRLFCAIAPTPATVIFE